MRQVHCPRLGVESLLERAADDPPSPQPAVAQREADDPSLDLERQAMLSGVPVAIIVAVAGSWVFFRSDGCQH